MRVIIEKDYDAISAKAATFVADLVRSKPNCVLGLATGSTPVGLYKELIRMNRDEGLDFSQVTTFNLDEYYGLSGDHEQSYRFFMNDNLFNHLNPRPKVSHVPDGMAADPEKYCEQYEQMILDAGGIDLQVLGIGGDGHIAFNEPGSSLGSRTRLEALTEETVEDNARFFESKDDVPRFAITMGVATILEARCCLILANGVKKAKPVTLAIEGAITSMTTASALQMHPNTIAVLDEDAACELELREYYKFKEQAVSEGFATKPAASATTA